jgi:arylformamidase
MHAGTPVYPGDAPYTQRWTSTFGPDSPVQVSALGFSAHLGAHADAPLHWDPQGAAIGALALERFIGPCLLLTTTRPPGSLLVWADLVGLVGLVDLAELAELAETPLPERILIRTWDPHAHDAPPEDTWRTPWSALAPELLDALAARGVRLIGIDTPSIDPADSLALPAHQAARRHGLVVLENLLLSTPPPGPYELIALPLRLTTAEASPVRAVLRPA